MILQLWVYDLCRILVCGAEFTRVYVQRDGTKPESFARRPGDRSAVR